MLGTARLGLACLGVFLLLTPGLAQVRTIDTERELSTRFGFTPAEMGQVRSGQPVVRLLPSNDSTEVGVFGVVRINEPPDRFVYWLKDVASPEASITLHQLAISRATGGAAAAWARRERHVRYRENVPRLDPPEPVGRAVEHPAGSPNAGTREARTSPGLAPRDVRQPVLLHRLDLGQTHGV